MSRVIWRIAHSEASSGWGGQEHRVLAELRGFQKRVHSTWLIGPPESAVAGRARAEGIAVLPMRMDKLRFALSVVQLASWLRRERVQILNTHSSRDGWLAGLAGRLARVPLILRSRHIDVSYPNRWSSRRAFLGLADHVITTSERITSNLQRDLGLPRERLSTIPTGIDLAFFSPMGAKANFPTALPAGRRLGMISVLRSWKGHTIFLQAIELLKKRGFAAGYVVAGEGPIRAQIEDEIAQRGLRADVTMIGHQEDVASVLRALDVLVMPSTKHEGIPQIGMQALSTKTPVVGSDAGGIPEIIEEGKTGRLFPAGNVSGLAEALEAVFREREFTDQMRENGRRLVEQQYSLDRMLDEIEKVYRLYLSAK